MAKWSPSIPSLSDGPERLNTDPVRGWLDLRHRAVDSAALDGLLDAEAYRQLIDG